MIILQQKHIHVGFARGRSSCFLCWTDLSLSAESDFGFFCAIFWWRVEWLKAVNGEESRREFLYFHLWLAGLLLREGS